MTTYEMLATVAGLGGLVLAALGLAVSLRRTRELDSQQSRLYQKQEELTELQLELAKKHADGVGASATTLTADVRVSLEGFSPNYRIVITNWGSAPARDVRLEVVSLRGPKPILRDDYEQKLPIPVLAVGGQCSLLTAVTFGTGSVFNASWQWLDPDGSLQKRESRLTLP